MNIKPIETVYNGYRFRSRLEARWAVFFRAVGIEEYTWQWPSELYPENMRIYAGKLVEKEYYSRFGLGIWVVPDADPAKVLEACKLAREARFEYGEKPKV